MITSKLITGTLLGATLLALSSCDLYKEYQIPTDQSAIVDLYAQEFNKPLDPAALGNLDWKLVFADPLLQQYIQAALDNNTDLKNAKLNVDIANAQLKGAKLSFFPSVAFAPQGTGSKVHMQGAEWGWGYTLPLSVSWEADIFGKLLNTKRGAQAAVYRSEAYQQAARSQIIAAVANTYYAMATIQAQLQLSRETAESWQQSVQVMRDLKEAGRVTEAAVVQSDAQYNSILAQITDLEASVVQLNNTMSLLLNSMPATWEVNTGATLQMPVMFLDGVPMSQLAARPDVRAAEQTMAAAYYATNSAKAAFYPGLNIISNGGFTNSLGSLIMNPGKWFINLAASLTAPIFSRGANISRLEAAKAQQKQALNSFEYTLMSASAEVSNSLTAYEKSLEKSQYLIKQVDDLSKAVEYTQELLRLGTNYTTYLEVLTAQQTLLQSQMAQLSCAQLTSQSIVNLYQALGGGR